MSHDGEQRRRLIRLAILLAILIGVMMALSDLATRIQQRLGFDYVAQQVKLLDNDPIQVQNFVSQQIGIADYRGFLRGPVATLWAGSGSPLDRAVLLMSMLQSCGEEAQLARSGATWWVDSPAVMPPGEVFEADWRGTLVPSSASHRLELEIRTGGLDDPLRVEFKLAELSDDPLMLVLDAGYLVIRQPSQRKPIASCTLPEACEELQIVCRTLLPDDSVSFEAQDKVALFREKRKSLLAMDAEQPALCAVLIVLTAAPPLNEDVRPEQMSGHLLEKAVSLPYQAAANLFRNAPKGSALPHYLLATVPPVDSVRPGEAPFTIQVFGNPRPTELAQPVLPEPPAHQD